MPLLVAAGRRVIASSKYDMTTVAAEFHGFAEALGLVAVIGLDVVGHDIGPGSVTPMRRTARAM
jgi:hypothetical protein